MPLMLRGDFDANDFLLILLFVLVLYIVLYFGLHFLAARFGVHAVWTAIHVVFGLIVAICLVIAYRQIGRRSN